MDSLPCELIIYILELCDPISLVTCRAVCKLIYRLIEETICLQYHIDLYADGMVETDLKCSLTLEERLCLLRSRRAAWKELRWSQRLTPMISSSWNAYELVDGIFSKTLDLSMNNNARGIVFTALPSRDVPGTLTKIDNVGIPFRDFAMDPTQDLVVYMQCSRVSGPLNRMLVTLHFRTMSSNRPHPHARQPLTNVVLNSINIIDAVIQTVNNVVGFMAWDHNGSQLYIWDWMQCALLVEEDNLHCMDDFAFISDRAYVLISAIPTLCLRVYTFGSDYAHAQTGFSTLRATLRFPPLNERVSVSELAIHTGPYTTTPTPQSLHFGAPKPFIRDSRCRIHIIGLQLWDSLSIDGTTSCIVVVHNRTFLSLAGDDSDADLDPTPHDLEWLAWGPKNTYWLRGRTGSAWLRYVHGERLVRLQDPTEDGPRDLEVYDFGTPRTPWHDKGEDVASMFHSSVFDQPVVGHLPCRIVRKQGDFPYSGFMIDEERLIGLKRDFADQSETVDVFTF